MSNFEMIQNFEPNLTFEIPCSLCKMSEMTVWFLSLMSEVCVEAQLVNTSTATDHLDQKSDSCTRSPYDLCQSI